MPTGYTHYVINGDVDNLKDFAKLCMRAFGATIHMREESLDVDYEPPTPSDYHEKALKGKREELIKIKEQSDESIIQEIRDNWIDREVYLNEQVEETKKTAEKLKTLIEEVTNWTPPSDDHIELKNFMLQQLNDTLKQDGSTSYYEQELNHLNVQKKEPINPTESRENRIRDIEKDIVYHEEKQQEENDRCNERIEWVETLLNSFKNKKD